MTDHKKVCWNCGSKNMKPIFTWYECQDCGATHVPSIKLRPDIISSGNVEEPGDNFRRTRRSRHPTPAAARQARLA